MGSSSEAVRGKFVPDKVVLFRPASVESPEISNLAEFTRYQRSIKDKATAYVCVNYQCKLPTTDAGKCLSY